MAAFIMVAASIMGMGTMVVGATVIGTPEMAATGTVAGTLMALAPVGVSHPLVGFGFAVTEVGLARPAPLSGCPLYGPHAPTSASH